MTDSDRFMLLVIVIDENKNICAEYDCYVLAAKQFYVDTDHLGWDFREFYEEDELTDQNQKALCVAFVSLTCPGKSLAPDCLF